LWLSHSTYKEKIIFEGLFENLDIESRVASSRFKEFKLSKNIRFHFQASKGLEILLFAILGYFARL
jgi:hypothetical protein